MNPTNNNIWEEEKMYSDNNRKAVYGESYIYEKLISEGIDVEWLAINNRQSLADFKTSEGKTIDAKIAYVNKLRAWQFNFHHHNKKQIGIDFYICLLIRDNEPIIFIFPSSIIRGKSLSITRSSLDRGKYGYFKNNWSLLVNSS